MNKTLLLHELLNMVNKDKWTEVLKIGNLFYINSHDHDSLEEYQ